MVNSELEDMEEDRALGDAGNPPRSVHMILTVSAVERPRIEGEETTINEGFRRTPVICSRGIAGLKRMFRSIWQD